jgi:hypothetical protein
MVDSSKSGPHAGEESRPFFDRQTHLAQLVGDMMVARRQQRDASDANSASGSSVGGLSLRKKQPRAKDKGGLARGLLERDLSSANMSSPRGVVVPAINDVQRNLDTQVDALRATRDERARRYEESQLERVSASVAGVQKFLHEAMSSSKASNNMLRKANMLANARVGRNMGYGWAIDGLLRSQGLDVDGEAK